MSKLLDTEFYNRLEGDSASQDAFHLLRQKMFEANAVQAKLKAEAEAKILAEAEVKANAVQAKAAALEKLRETYFARYKSEFLTDNLLYSGKARAAAEAAGLRFSSFLENEVEELDDGTSKIVATKIKCVARIPAKKKK